MGWVGILLSSALVSGLVSALVTHFFQGKEYLRDKKLSVFLDFLDHLEKAFPPEHLGGKTEDKELIKHIAIGCYKLQRVVWKICLLSQNKEICELAEKIRSNCVDYSDLVEELVPAKGKEEERITKELGQVISRINKMSDRLVALMNDEINRWY